LIPSSRQFRSGWEIAYAWPFATFHWLIRIRMRNTRPKQPKRPASKASSGRCQDLLFENQYAFDDEDLAQYATALGPDIRRLIGEVVAGTHTGRVREDFRSGARGGGNGTPTVFINGVWYDGETSVNALVAALTQPNSR